ncbi:MAG: hypothetical protein RR315_03845, partial [Oscillospiraceae bacterium]
LNQLVDFEKEFARLNKELDDCKKDINFLSSKLNNAGFVKKAPPEIIEGEKAKLKKAEEKLEKIQESIDELKK